MGRRWLGRGWHPAARGATLGDGWKPRISGGWRSASPPVCTGDPGDRAGSRGGEGLERSGEGGVAGFGRKRADAAWGGHPREPGLGVKVKGSGG